MSLFDFIYNSPTAPSLVENAAELLRSNGYCELCEKDQWKTIPSKFFVVRNRRNIIAINYKDLTSGRIFVSHTDVPNLRVGRKLEITAGCHKVDASPSGNGLWYSWLDRDLRIAGTVTVKAGDGKKTINVASKVPVAVIPNLAVHLSRGSGVKPEFKMPDHFSPIFGLRDSEKPNEKHMFMQSLMKMSCVSSEEEILDYDIQLMDEDRPSTVGISDEFVCSQGIDGCGTSFISLQGLLSAKDPESGLNAVALLDNEAFDQNFIRNILARIGAGTSFFHKSTLFTLSGNKGVNPNGDIDCSIPLGKGITYTWSAGMKYATSPQALAKVVALSEKFSIKLSPYAPSIIPKDNKATTLTSAYGLSSVELGIPVIGLKSIREVCHKNDIETMEKFIKILFEEFN